MFIIKNLFCSKFYLVSENVYLHTYYRAHCPLILPFSNSFSEIVLTCCADVAGGVGCPGDTVDAGSVIVETSDWGARNSHIQDYNLRLDNVFNELK